MISYRGREGKRGKVFKMTKNIERLYKEGKCRDCSVVVTRMDFAKILGKFTKVKIQYESSSSPKTYKTSQANKTELQPPVSNARLKNNENGMVLIHRNSYNRHPVKNAANVRKYTNKVTSSPSRQTSTNILRENNVLKNSVSIKDKISNCTNDIHQNGKQYAIIFNSPTTNNINNFKCDLTLSDLLPKVDNHILPSEEWCIDYFPKKDEPKNDKVYDRIAAELEDLMYNEKSDVKFNKPESTENKADEFPSIMDILNDNINPEINSESKDQSSNIDFKDNLESSDVEAMLLGKASDNKIDAPMEVDNTDVNKLIDDVVQFNSDSQSPKKELQVPNEIENPHSPSILDEALQKGIEEHLPNIQLQSSCLTEDSNVIEQSSKLDIKIENDKDITNDEISNELMPKSDIDNSLNIPSTLKIEDVTHVIFKKVVNGICTKSVTCPRNLKYSLELEEKSVEFLGAPKYISNLEDLQVLLQIVNETDLKSLYVLY